MLTADILLATMCLSDTDCFDLKGQASHYRVVYYKHRKRPWIVFNMQLNSDNQHSMQDYIDLTLNLFLYEHPDLKITC